MYFGIFEFVFVVLFIVKLLEWFDQDLVLGFLVIFDQFIVVEVVVVGEMQDLGQVDVDEDIGDDVDVVDINVIVVG